MERYSEHLSPKSLENLKYVIGQDVLGFYASQIDVHAPWCSAPLLVVPIGGGTFVVFQSSGRETPQNGLDYYALSVTIEEKPPNIPLIKPEDGTVHFGSPISVFSMDAPRASIATIEVIECKEVGSAELVEFDCALLLKYDDGRTVLISAERSITEYMQITSDAEVIGYFLREGSIRLTLPS